MKVGDKIRIIDMKDEPEYAGRTGIISSIDAIGQIHGSWGGCALIPAIDDFEVTEMPEDVKIFFDVVWDDNGIEQVDTFTTELEGRQAAIDRMKSENCNYAILREIATNYNDFEDIEVIKELYKD